MVNSTQEWYALRVRSRHEKMVGTSLRNKGYESLVPLYTKTRKWRNRKIDADLPLFPGYVFCLFDPFRRLPILQTAGVIQVVGFGGQPTPVLSSEIEALERIVESGVRAEPWPFLEVGQEVEITRGPLAGTRGFLERFHSSHRLVVSVTLLQRSVSVEIDGHEVRPVKLDLSAYRSVVAMAAAN